MIKKAIILGLLGCVLILTGCSNTHQIDDIPNYDNSSFKTATVIHHHRDQHMVKNVESYSNRNIITTDESV